MLYLSMHTLVYMLWIVCTLCPAPRRCMYMHECLSVLMGVVWYGNTHLVTDV